MTTAESPARHAVTPGIFAGRVAVVTGGTRGGAAITSELARSDSHRRNP